MLKNNFSAFRKSKQNEEIFPKFYHVTLDQWLVTQNNLFDLYTWSTPNVSKFLHHQAGGGEGPP